MPRTAAAVGIAGTGQTWQAYTSRPAGVGRQSDAEAVLLAFPKQVGGNAIDKNPGAIQDG